MKNYKFYSVLVALLAIGAVLTGCTKTPEQIYNDQASGVALVLTQYYYSVELDDGTTIYFSGVDDEGDGAFVFQMADEKPLKLNDQLSMIGYNHGIELAATREGIKAQLTTGNVSQKPDGERVMYTISAMQGSSGSPVLNEYGEVVAVNFAKIRDTDNFNFGIPLNRIKQFLNR